MSSDGVNIPLEHLNVQTEPSAWSEPKILFQRGAISHFPAIQARKR